MLRIVHQADMSGFRILRRFRGHHSAAIVVLFSARRIDAAHNQPQPAPFCNSPREESEIVEDVFLLRPRCTGFRFTQGLTYLARIVALVSDTEPPSGKTSNKSASKSVSGTSIFSHT